MGRDLASPSKVMSIVFGLDDVCSQSLIFIRKLLDPLCLQDVIFLMNGPNGETTSCFG